MFISNIYTNNKTINNICMLMVWAAASQTKIKKLQTIQNKFLRIAL